MLRIILTIFHNFHGVLVCARNRLDVIYVMMALEQTLQNLLEVLGDMKCKLLKKSSRYLLKTILDL